MRLPIMARTLSFVISFLLVCSTANAQSLSPFRPTHGEMVARYKANIIRDSIVKNTVLRTSVRAHWLKGDQSFWYLNILADSATEYLLADITGKKKPLFDKAGLASQLSKTLGEPVDAQKLKLDDLTVSPDKKELSFSYKKLHFNYRLSGDALTKVDSLKPFAENNHQFNDQHSRWENYATDSLSPDKKYVAYISHNNVFIKPVNGIDSIQYTHDGTDSLTYGSLAWSPDSKYVVGYKIKPFEDSLVYYVLTSQKGTTRGQLKSQPYKQPGDPFTTYEMFLFPVATKQPVKVQAELLDFFDAPMLHWNSDNQHFLYEKVDRGHQRFRIIEVSVANGETRTLLDEKSTTFIYESRLFSAYLPGSNEIIYTSEKDGWRHIYLVDSKTGAIKTQVTKGNWVIGDIDSIDLVKREIWFSANGRNAGEDPYYQHYYRIGLDGNNLVDLTPEKGNHTIRYSSSKKYYLDTWSEVNVAPVTWLRETTTGKKIAEIEKADISRYVAIIKHLPQPFVAKGRDGVTDIWGVFCVPADFDSSKSYPVIENIYAGPQDAFVPKSFMGYGEMQSLANLGFIVVQMDGMGTANRSKAFHDVCWKNLADAGFPDRILWMQALAKKYPFADISKVGLYGTSAGGQNALGGLLFHPEFYKAAVAACGCHDNRVDKQWWNEQWMGYPVGPHYAEQSNVTNAAKLQGDLLLIVGEADTNVPPESTYRVADALIKAGKSFDFLPVPGMGHSDGGVYGRQKKRDFFVQHLLGVAPPERNANELTNP